MKLWLPIPDNPPADLDLEMSRFLLAQVGDQFCDLLEQEKESLAVHMSEGMSIRLAVHISEGNSSNTIIRNVLTRRREYGTYLATARRHRRRIKMQKRDE